MPGRCTQVAEPEWADSPSHAKRLTWQHLQQQWDAAVGVHERGAAPADWQSTYV